MKSQLQRCFSNNVATLCRRLLIYVFFATLLQRRDVVERLRNLKTTNYNVLTTSRVYWETTKVLVKWKEEYRQTKMNKL